jgi:hypothetical protein
LAKIYEAAGETDQARLARAKSSTIIQGLADSIKDETLRVGFLAGLQIQPVLQSTHTEVSQVPRGHAEQQEC